MQTRTALKKLTGGKIDVDAVSPSGPLAQNADWLLKQHEQRTSGIKVAQRRHASMAAMPVLAAARKVADELVKERVLPDDTLIVSRFDAFSVVKDASHKCANDMELRKFALHLERLWHTEPLGALTAGALTRLRDHYQGMNPRSAVGEVVDTCIPKVSFKTLPVAKLVRIASQISNQEEYDAAIERNGLYTDDPISVRARTFIRELVNRASKTNVSSVQAAETKDTTETKGVSKSTSIKKLHGRDIATRIASRLYRDAEQFVEPKTDEAVEVKEEDKVAEDVGIDGTGVLTHAAELRHAALKNLAMTGEAMPKEAVAPEGWEGTVKKMKKSKNVENPWALAHHMKSKGAEPHYTEKGKKKEQFKKDSAEKLPDANFEPKINDQQPDQVAVPECGCEALESNKEFKQVRHKAALTASHPLVDDGCDHFPIDTDELMAVSIKSAESMTKTPAWWLGSLDELKSMVKAAALPPSLEKFKFKKKTDKKDEKKGNPFSKDKKASITKDVIEQTIVAGREFTASGYSISVGQNDIVQITTKSGSKKYPLVDLDGAVADFMYLVSTAKHPAGSPPPPVFFIREGIRMTCPGCLEVNSYDMPKIAADLTCNNCNVVIPSKVITSAFKNDMINEEAILTAVTPNDLQDEFGDKFAKAAEMMGADGVGADGCKAEAYSLDVPVEKLAEVWDFMVEAGFKPIAQFENMDKEPIDEFDTVDDLSPTHEQEEGEELEAAEELEEIAQDIVEIADGLKGMEHHGQAGPVPGAVMPPSGGTVAEGLELDGTPGSGLGEQWADWQVIQAAMMHYQHQNMGVADAIGQFQKDYMKERKDKEGNLIGGQQFDQNVVVQVAAAVFGTDAMQLGEQMALGMTPPGMAGPEVEAPVSEPPGLGEAEVPEMPPSRQPGKPNKNVAKKKRADIPSTEVNAQQPDAVQPEKLGPDSEQAVEIPGPGKVKTQTGKPQGNVAPTDLGISSDAKDPGTFKAESPKDQHPVTDQSGTSLPATDLGEDSDTGENATTKSMESKSKAAPSVVQSK